MSLLTDVDPRPLAIARIGVGLATALNSFEASGYLWLSQHPEKIALPAWSWLPTLSETLILLLLGVLLTAAVCVMLGLFTRTAAALAGILLWALFLLEQQTYSHHMMLNGWLLLWLALSRADAAWSLPAREHGRHPVPLWTQLLLMSQLSVCYFFAAAVKLNPTFLSGSYLDRVTNLSLPSWMFLSMALGTIVVEFSLAFLLWVRRTRRFVALAGVALHVAIPLTMTPRAPLIAFSITCLSLYPLFFNRGHNADIGGQIGQRDETSVASEPGADLAADRP